MSESTLPAGPGKSTAEAAPGARQRLARIWDSDLLWSFRRSPVAIVAAVVTLLILLGALLAPVLAPQRAFDPGSLNLMDGFLKPMERSPASGQLHVLGTDNQGRDIL